MSLIVDLTDELAKADAATRAAFAEALEPRLKQDRLRGEKDALITTVVNVGKQAIDELVARVSTQIENEPDAVVMPDAKMVAETFVKAVGL